MGAGGRSFAEESLVMGVRAQAGEGGVHPRGQETRQG